MSYPRYGPPPARQSYSRYPTYQRLHANAHAPLMPLQNKTQRDGFAMRHSNTSDVHIKGPEMVAAEIASSLNSVAPGSISRNSADVADPDTSAMDWSPTAPQPTSDPYAIDVDMPGAFTDPPSQNSAIQPSTYKIHPAPDNYDAPRAKRACRGIASAAPAASSAVTSGMVTAWPAIDWTRAGKMSIVRAIQGTILVAAFGHAYIYRPAYRIIKDIRQKYRDYRHHQRECRAEYRAQTPLPPMPSSPWERLIENHPDGGKEIGVVKCWRPDRVQHWQARREILTPSEHTQNVPKNPLPRPDSPLPRPPSPLSPASHRARIAEMRKDRGYYFVTTREGDRIKMKRSKPRRYHISLLNGERIYEDLNKELYDNPWREVEDVAKKYNLIPPRSLRNVSVAQVNEDTAPSTVDADNTTASEPSQEAALATAAAYSGVIDTANSNGHDLIDASAQELFALAERTAAVAAADAAILNSNIGLSQPTASTLSRSTQTLSDVRAAALFPREIARATQTPDNYDPGADTDGGSSKVSDTWQPQSVKQRLDRIGSERNARLQANVTHGEPGPDSIPANQVKVGAAPRNVDISLPQPEADGLTYLTPPHVRRRVKNPEFSGRSSPRMPQDLRTPRSTVSDADGFPLRPNSPPDATILSSTYNSPLAANALSKGDHARSELVMTKSPLADATFLPSTYNSPAPNIDVALVAADAGNVTEPSHGVDTGTAAETLKCDEVLKNDSPSRGQGTGERKPDVVDLNTLGLVVPKTPAGKSVKFWEDSRITGTLEAPVTPEAKFAELSLKDEVEGVDGTPKATLHSAEKTTRRTRAQQKKEEFLKSLDQYPIEPLSDEWQEKVEQALREGVEFKSRHDGKNVKFTAEDFRRVVPPHSTRGTDAWLNDEVINGYLKLVVTQGKKNDRPNQVPSHYAFNSFLYTTLVSKGYKGVSRWATRGKIGGKSLLETEKIFIPINSGAHWTLCVVSGKAKTITCYDSLGGDGRGKAEHLMEWLRGELATAFKQEEWKIISRAPSPRQQNSDDCGVFTITSARQLMLGKEPLSYGPEDIPIQRWRIVAELVNDGLLKAK